MKKKNSTLLELLLGIGATGILAQIVILCVFKQHLSNAIGLWLGVVLAAGMAVHMSQTIHEAVDLGADGAVKYMQRAAAIRLGVVAVVVAAVLYFKIGSPIPLIVGLFTLKISAYLQPFLHKLCEKRMKQREGR